MTNLVNICISAPNLLTEESFKDHINLSVGYKVIRMFYPIAQALEIVSSLT